MRFPTPYSLLPTPYSLLPTYYLLLITYYLLLITYYLKKVKDIKPWYKSKTLWWIVASTIAGSAQPIGSAIDNRNLKFADLGGLMAIVVTNGMAGYSRIVAQDKLGGANGSQE